MSLPILMQPPGRSTFTQSGLIELGKPVETLADGSFKEAKIPKPKKKKNAEPELPQPAVGPPPIVSGAPRRRGGGDDEVLKVFQPTAQTEAVAPVDKVAPGQAVSAIPKTRAVKFAKGSQEAKDYMAKIRGLRKPKAKETTVSAPAAPAAVAPAPAAAAKPKKTRKAKAEPAIAAAAKSDEEDADLILANELLDSVKPKKTKKHKNNPDEAEVAYLQAKLAKLNKKLEKFTD